MGLGRGSKFTKVAIWLGESRSFATMDGEYAVALIVAWPEGRGPTARNRDGLPVRDITSGVADERPVSPRRPGIFTGKYYEVDSPLPGDRTTMMTLTRARA